MMETKEINLNTEKQRKHNRLKSQMENMDSIKFSFIMPRYIHTAFKRATAKQRTNMKKVMIAHIQKYVDENKD